MMKVFHAGYDIIPTPDIHRGRKNADFGQGFYLSDSHEFSSRWVRQRPGMDIIVNTYELDDSDLKTKYFERNREWFKYVFSNRRSMPDQLWDTDIVIGPIANDTIYNTMGMITSGYLSDEESVELLCVGPLYRQIVLKTQKAVEHLKYISSESLSEDAIKRNVTLIAAEEEKYLEEFTKVMQGF